VAESRKSHLEAKGAGHYGIFSGSRWRDVVYPQVKAFIAANEPARSGESGESGAKIAANQAAKKNSAAKKAIPLAKREQAAQVKIAVLPKKSTNSAKNINAHKKSRAA
jgi:poly(3-hydroxybutyrate) depolymerase